MTRSQWFKRLSALCLVSASLLLTPAAIAQKHLKQNLSQLTNQASSIVSGQVVSVTDGFDERKRPYTQITIRVGMDAKHKHKAGSEYTFRQFGLLKPRSMGNGKVYLGVSPEGFARWSVGEQVVAFMNPDLGAGLTSTVGLEQGKFIVQNGKVSNQLGNIGLFDGMNTQSLSPEEQSLITTAGAVDAAAFMSLVGKLVQEAK
ncbi:MULTISPECIES: hypothetical protein [Shewanella]|uniref:hypothetical protein n=1 Tax=Shewanella TaxID=22 RepID=UPI00068FB3CC|nr:MULTISPECIES: hypothetical protein [Shewanella]MCE9791879.1 hypothetical protein [Shewanella indica]TVP13448.1 hypothetical protein AYI96_02120 [Shewanella sp. MSW]BCV35255.1 hypothetical protein TUM17377_05830 [Shewanella chilikensis]GHB18300.1 hypothetical protein GCM10007107_34110 [Shewanella indica]